MKRTSPDDGNAERLEITGGDVAESGGQPSFSRTTADRECRLPSPVLERGELCETCGVHARNSGDALFDRVIVPAVVRGVMCTLSTFVVSIPDGTRSSRDLSHHECGTGRKDEGQRDFDDHQADLSAVQTFQRA